MYFYTKICMCMPWSIRVIFSKVRSIVPLCGYRGRYSLLPKRWDSKWSSEWPFRNPLWSSQVSFEKVGLQRNLNFDHSGFRFPLRRPLRVFSAISYNLSLRQLAVTCAVEMSYTVYFVFRCSVLHNILLVARGLLRISTCFALGDILFITLDDILKNQIYNCVT